MVSCCALTAEADPRLVHVGFVVDRAALVPVFLRVFRLSSGSSYPPVLNILSFICHRRYIIFGINYDAVKRQLITQDVSSAYTFGGVFHLVVLRGS